jgi:hypothetical protein
MQGKMTLSVQGIVDAAISFSNPNLLVDTFGVPLEIAKGIIDGEFDYYADEENEELFVIEERLVTIQ